MKSRHVILSLLFCAAWLNVQAQQTLEDLVKEAKADWMLGTWESQSDDGNTVKLVFSWDLDKHVIVLHGKMGEVEFKGYSVIEPGAEQVKYTGFDNRGVVSKGAWALESEELVLRLESRSPERGPTKMGVVFGGNATDGLQVRLHGISDSGDLVTPARTNLKFKKQK